MAVALRTILSAALAGDNACARCGGAVPVAPGAVELVENMHRDGRLEHLDPEGVRMLLLLGSLEAGCALADTDAHGRVRVACPPCASSDQLARADAVSCAGSASP